MSQKTPAKSSTPSSPLSINPALQTALGSLDVQLEAELARYRRQRQGRSVTSPQLPGHYPRHKPAVNQLEPTTASPISIAPAAPASPPVDINQQSAPMGGSPTPETRKSTQTEPTSPLFPPLPSQEAPLATTQEPTPADFPSLEESLERQGKLVVPTTEQSQPEDYLESSEKLRQTLAEQETTKDSQKPLTNRILTPLGVGSILLLLVSSATLTYIFRTSLGLDRFLETETPTTAKNSAATTVNEENELLGVNRPNLASDEFSESIDIYKLSELKASPTPNPISPIAPIPNSPLPEAAPPTASVFPLPQLPNPASNLPAALLPPPTPLRTAPQTTTPSVTPNSSPAQPESSTNKSLEQAKKSTPTPSTPTSAAPNSNNANSNLSKGFYYVLINSNDSSVLEKAQTIVPDAYVVNVPAGTRIAMGAFKLESEAKTLVDQLKQQGLSASIYNP